MKPIQPEKHQLEQIKTKHRLKLILLYGSHTTGQLHSKSDVDIAVLPENELNYLTLLQDLKESLQTINVDLADLSKADPLFLKRVTDQAVMLAGKASELEKLQLKAFHRYQDYLPYLKMEADFVKQKLDSYVSPE